ARRQLRRGPPRRQRPGRAAAHRVDPGARPGTLRRRAGERPDRLVTVRLHATPRPRALVSLCPNSSDRVCGILRKEPHMQDNNDQARPETVNRGRRSFLKVPLAVAAGGGLAYLGYLSRAGADKEPKPPAPRKPVLDEHDEKNSKLAHRVSPSL